MTNYPTLHLLLFFFNDTATTEIYTLSLHDALPIWPVCNIVTFFQTRSTFSSTEKWDSASRRCARTWKSAPTAADRKSTRLNSSHVEISYAVFCLKKKKKEDKIPLL